MAESIENQIAAAEEKFNKAKQELITIKDRIVQEIEKALPTVVDDAIGRLIEEHHETIISMPEENLRKLKEELRQAISVNVAKITSDLKTSDEWFECKSYGAYGGISEGISLESHIWLTIQSISTPIAQTLQKYGIDIRVDYAYSGYKYITPINLSYLGKTIEDLDKVLASAKTKHCRAKSEYENLVLKHKKQLAKKKWEALK